MAGLARRVRLAAKLSASVPGKSLRSRCPHGAIDGRIGGLQCTLRLRRAWRLASSGGGVFLALPSEKNMVLRHLERGYYWSLRLAPEASLPKHIFCGPNEIDGAECPNCHKGLLCVAKLDSSDARLRLGSTAPLVIPLLFCWTCAWAEEASSYHVLPSGAVQILRVREGGPYSSYPYEDYPPSFPLAYIELQPMPEEDLLENEAVNLGKQEQLERLDFFPRSQVGGEPCFLQGYRPEFCPVCGDELAFLASVSDDTVDGKGFTGSEFSLMHFVICTAHWTIASYSESS